MVSKRNFLIFIVFSVTIKFYYLKNKTESNNFIIPYLKTTIPFLVKKTNSSKRFQHCKQTTSLFLQ